MPEINIVGFLLFCIAAVGMTLIITRGNIFAPLRLFISGWSEQIRQRREQRAANTGKSPRCKSCIEWLNDLINCDQCMGFWCGLFCGLLIALPSEGSTLTLCLPLTCLQILFVLFCCGLGGSFLAPLSSNIVDMVFYYKMNALRQLEDREAMIAQRQAELPIDEINELEQNTH